MRKKIIFITILSCLLVLITLTAVYGINLYQKVSYKNKQNKIIEDVINSHPVNKENLTTSTDPFGEDNILNVLIIGLDNRVGQINGHCDVIQYISLNKLTQTITITAVPRGTYSPLPIGKGTTSTDYYVSNACGLVGLEYGIEQIEKILGQKADYLVVVGFSETLGILRNLKLPTTATLQWLRQRHVYQIGEPQRAHNHSVFLKYLLTNFTPVENSKTNKVLQYLIYKTVNTNLSFADAEMIAKTVSDMNLLQHPEKIILKMRPEYVVQNIEYLPENLEQTLKPLPTSTISLLDTNDYSNLANAGTQTKLLEIINQKISDNNFIDWAFKNNLWLQIEDNGKRLETQYILLEKYLSTVTNNEERKSIISDYILEMQEFYADEWLNKGEELLTKEIAVK